MADSVRPNPTPEQLVADLMLLLDLQPRGGDLFIGRNLGFRVAIDAAPEP